MVLASEILLVVAAYLLGSIPSGYLLARAKGIDIRQKGSGNIGATNVARSLGWALGVLTLLADAAKGFLPTIAALNADLVLPVPAEHLPLLGCAAGLLAFLGHLFPVWLRLQGGKGVATGLGVVLAVAPWAALAGFAVYAPAYAALRISSVGSLAGAVAAIVVAALTAADGASVGLVVLLVALIIWRHKENLKRLWRRQEKKISPAGPGPAAGSSAQP